MTAVSVPHATEHRETPDAAPVFARRTIRPNAHLPGQSRLVAAALMLPVFAAMLWFAIPCGTWPRVLVTIAILAAGYALAHYLFTRVRIVVDRHGIIENGFFSRNRRIAAKRIASALLVPVYRGQSLDSSPQLFLLDARGLLLLRMRGQYWPADQLQAVATVYGVPVRTVIEPISAGQLRAEFGTYVYWFERWPWLAALSAASVIVAVTASLIVLASTVAPIAL